MQQASSAANGLLAVMANLGQAFSQAASASATTTGAVNQQTQALNNASSAAASFAKNWINVTQTTSGGASASFSRNWINTNQEIVAAGQKGSAQFARNWINAAEEVKKAIGSIPGFIRPGAPAMPSGEFTRAASPAEMARVFGRLPLDSTFAADRAANEALQRSIQRQLREQAQAAREAAHATDQAFTRIRMSWVQFGRDMMSLADRIANSLATTISHTVPFFGPILGGAIRGAGMGGSIGGGLGGAVGGTVGMFAGGPPGMLAGQMVGTVAGYGVGSLVGAGIGGQAAALVQGVTLAVNALEKAFDAAAGAAKRVFSAVVSLASEFQRIGTAFEVFTGSAAKGNKLFADMQQLAVQTPYNLRQMVDISQTLLAMGVPFEDVTNSMRMLGDVAAGDVDRLRRLTLAFSEVVAEGKLTGQRMRQFAAAGVGVADIAQTMGIPVAALREQMREGSVPAQAVIDTFERITSAGGRFFEMSQRQARTVAGAWSNLIDKLEIMGAKLGGAVFQRFDVAGMIGRVGDFVGENAPMVLEKLIGLLKAVQAAFTGLFQAVVPYWQQLIQAVETFVGKLDMTPAGLNNIRQAFVSLGNTIMQTFGQVVRLIAQLAALALPFVTDMLKNLDRFQGAGGVMNIKWSWMDDLKNRLMPSPAAEEKILAKTPAQAMMDTLQGLTKGLQDFLPGMDRAIQEAMNRAGVAAMGQVNAYGGRFGVAAPGALFRGGLPSSVEQAERDAAMSLAVAARRTPAALMMGRLGGAFAGATPVIEIKPSEEALKLVDDLGKTLREGLTPLDQFANRVGLIKEAFGPLAAEQQPGFVGPPARESMLQMQAMEFQRLLKGFGQDVPSPTAKVFGTKEAGDAIADAQNRGVKNLEAKLEEANQQRQEANGELKEIRQILDRREKAGQPLIPGNIDN